MTLDRLKLVDFDVELAGGLTIASSSIPSIKRAYSFAEENFDLLNTYVFVYGSGRDDDFILGKAINAQAWHFRAMVSRGVNRMAYFAGLDAAGEINPQHFDRNPYLIYFTHLMGGKLSMPWILLRFDEAAWPVFGVPQMESAGEWNKMSNSVRLFFFSVQVTALIRLEDYLAWCERKGCDPERLESKGRFLVRTINRTTEDDMLDRVVDPKRHIPSVAEANDPQYARACSQGFRQRLQPLRELGDVYLMALRYIIDPRDTFDRSESVESMFVNGFMKYPDETDLDALGQKEAS